VASTSAQKSEKKILVPAMTYGSFWPVGGIFQASKSVPDWALITKKIPSSVDIHADQD